MFRLTREHTIQAVPIVRLIGGVGRPTYALASIVLKAMDSLRIYSDGPSNEPTYPASNSSLDAHAPLVVKMHE
jgi:hypothetical protein